MAPEGNTASIVPGASTTGSAADAGAGASSRGASGTTCTGTKPDIAVASKVAAVEHHPALPWQQMPAFMKALASHRGVAALALRFAILTAARTGEVRGATWGEIDLDSAVWTIPAKRMKAGRLHRVPLSAPALKLLRSIRPEKAAADLLILAAPRSKRPLSDMSLSMLVRGMSLDGLAEGLPPRWRDATGRAVVPHGFRSTFRDWAGETRPEGREVVERALAHTVRDKVEAAYARSDLLEKRRALMEAWGGFCCGMEDERGPKANEGRGPGGGVGGPEPGVRIEAAV